MPSIAIVTCQNIPEPDNDESLMLDVCRASGIDVELVPWEDAVVDWSRFDLVALRSTWNYYEFEASFRNWIDSVSKVSTLCNGRDLILWNLDKHYLDELRDLGIPVVPTRYLSSPSELQKALMEEGWTEFVIKPTVSAGSYMTKRFGIDQVGEAEAFLSEILNDRGAMVQKFMSRVADGGEIALIHIDGELTHGIIKEPRFHGGEESVSAAVTPNEEQSDLAKCVLETVREPWLYARVDLMISDEGQWVLSELELIEPSLFFVQNPVALDRYVEGLKRWATKG